MPNLQLAPSTVNAIRQYIDEGIPLEDLDMSDNTRRRVRVAEQVYERLQQDPMLDVNRCLMRTFGRSRDQAIKDKLVVEMFVEAMEQPSRQILVYRARKQAESLIRTGQQLGDPKWIDKGLSQLIRIDGLDKPEQDTVNIGDRTFNLPPIFVRVEEVDSKYKTVSAEERAALIQKYGGVVDENMRMVKEKELALVEAERKPADNNEEVMDLTTEDF